MSTKKSYFFEYDLILVFIYYIFIFYYIKMLQTLQLVVSILYDTLYITFSYLFFHFNYILLFLLYKIYFLNFLKIFLFKAKIHTLLNTAYISLSLRKNSKNPLEKQLRNTLSKTRRRVETSFSQLAEQFNINKVLAKSKWGLMLRITLKILAHNILFIINNILKNNKVAQIKQLVFG